MKLDNINTSLARFDFRDPAMGHVKQSRKTPLRKFSCGARTTQL